MSRGKTDTVGALFGRKRKEIARDSLAIGLAPLALFLSGCAVSPAPESINASYVSSIPYQSWTCSQLSQEQASLDAALTNASAQENKIRSDERVHSALSMLVPLPPDTGSSNVTSQVEIAHLKGEREAVRQAAVHNSCPVQAIQTQSAPSVSRNPA
jgi:hypothetical protein